MTYVDNPFKSPRLLSICTGIRGIERGIERAIGSIRAAAYVEIEAFIIENLLAGMEAGMVDAAPIWANIKTFDAEPFCNCVDGIIGGYPCQPFSTAGERRGTEDPRHLWPYVEGIIRTIGPIWGFFENVSGHLTLGFDQVYQSLSGMDYAVEAGIFTAEEVGAPHQRERLFILAIRKDCLAYTHGASARNQSRSPRWGSGQSDVRQADRTISPVRSGSTSSYVAHPVSSGQPQQRNDGKQAEESNTGVSYSGPELGDSTSSNKSDDRQYGSSREEQTGGSGSEMVYPSSDNVQGIIGGSINSQGWEREKHRSPGPGGPGDLWPARPGEQQYDWEAPHTIEPGLGITVDGYNFREDLLRAAGNSVVEQTAELAFRTLLKKHGL